MKIIKFRAYDGMDWVYSSAVEYREEWEQWCIYDLEKEEWFHCSEPQQYTGLTDKNGVEVYEGDIVNVNHYGGTPRYETVKFYTNAGFAGLHPFVDTGYHWSSYNCEIVGNIYQNPELLECEVSEKVYPFKVGDTVITKNEGRVYLSEKMFDGAVRRFNAGEIIRVEESK